MRRIFESEAFWLVFGVIFVIGFLVFFVGVLPNNADRARCASTAEMLNMEWRHSFGSRCEVNTPDLGWWEPNDYIKMLAVRQIREGK
jgi:hypothetical protein